MKTYNKITHKESTMSNYFNRFSKRKEELESLYQELYSDNPSLAELEKEMEAFSIVRSDELNELDSKREDTLWYLNNNVLALTDRKSTRLNSSHL